MNIPIVFSINNTYVKQLATVIASILANSSKINTYEFHILTSDIDSNNQKILTSYIKTFENASINFINMSEKISKINLENFMSRRKKYNYISIETYFRFFIPELFQNYEKVLYLDADILVFKDVAELFNENIDNYYCAAVQDTYMADCLKSSQNKTSLYKHLSYKQYLQSYLNKKNLSYFNAGVILLNITKLISDNVIVKLWEFTEEKSPLEFQDQDVLNAVFESAIKYVDQKWNILKRNNDNVDNAYIYHFVGPEKPWGGNFNYKYNFSYINDWWLYFKNTPYFSEQDKKTKKIINIKRKISQLQQIIQSIISLRNDGDKKILIFLGIRFSFKRNKM